MVFTTKRFQKVFKVVGLFFLVLLALNLTHIYLYPDLSVADEYISNLRDSTRKYADNTENHGIADLESNSQNEADSGLHDFEKQNQEIKQKLKESSGSGNSDPLLREGANPAGTDGFLVKGDSETKQHLERKTRLHEFYGLVFKYLQLYSPKGKTEAKYEDGCKLSGDIGYREDDHKNWFKLTGKELGNCLKISQQERALLKENHSNYVNALSKLVLPKGSYKGDGIVTVGGGKFSMMAFLIIKTMRTVGTTLPVEVLIPPDDEGDNEFCNVLLPQYNAKCIFLSDVFPKDLIEEFDFKGYQFKSLAIIASSFENLLLLDADNFPIKPLDGIFQKEVYQSTGLIVWPDFWRRTTHPAYYHIADIPLSPERVRNVMDDITPPSVYTKDLSDLSDVPLHDLKGTIPDVSTESGQLMINKLNHLPTVLLSLYYNVNGPSWYYPIFSQNSSGQGDKETFIAAANFYDLKFYQVRSSPAVDGYHRSNNEGFRGVCMLQHDFTQDYERYRLAKQSITTKYSTTSQEYNPDYDVERDFYSKYFTDDPVDIMFVHSHLPKFDPIGLALTDDLTEDGKHIRSYRNLKKMNGYDLELENFKVFKEYVCVNRVNFKYFQSAVKDDLKVWENICKYVDNRLDYLIESHEDALEGKF